MTLVRRAGRALLHMFWPLLLLGALAGLGYARLWAPVAVRTSVVGRGEVVREAFGRGTVESQREAAVGFDMVGRLSEVLVDEGARVTLGQELARLETNQAEADLRAAKTGVASARAALLRLAAEEERARALLLAADREAKRSQALFDAGATPGQTRDDAADRLRVARADLDRVLAQRAEATRGIEVASSGAEQRQVVVLRATLLAPFDGLITKRLREPGDTVAVGSTILRIVDTRQVHVRAALDETVLPALADDQRAAIYFPGPSEPIGGKVSRISWEADRQTHEISVEVLPDKLDRRVAVGQRADARIELERHDDALRVPLSMVHRDERGPFLYVDRGGRIAEVRPELGLSGRDHVEVLTGLTEGEVLLASPTVGAPLSIGRRWKAE